MLTRSPGTQRRGGNCLSPGQLASMHGCPYKLGRVAGSFTKATEWGHRCPPPLCCSCFPQSLGPLPGLYPLLLCSLPPASHLSALPACLQPALHPHPEPRNPQHLSCSPETREPSPRLGDPRKEGWLWLWGDRRVHVDKLPRPRSTSSLSRGTLAWVQDEGAGGQSWCMPTTSLVPKSLQAP